MDDIVCCVVMPAVVNYALLFIMTKTLVSYNRVCLIPLVFSLLGMDASTAKAIAQTTFPFKVVYDTEVTLTLIPSTDISKAFVSGFNSDTLLKLSHSIEIQLLP